MSQFRIIYPGRSRILLDGGLNNKFERTIIQDNESPDCANVVFTSEAAETREGVDKVNTTAIASAVGDGIYTHRNLTGTETMVVFCNGGAHYLSGNSFLSIPSSTSVFTAGVRVAGALSENHIFFGNGNVIPYKYDGTYFTRHGVYAPTTTHTVATAGTGTVLSGAYSWKVTYVNSHSAEGDLGPAASMTLGSENASLTSIPVAPTSWGVAYRRVYRTTAGGSTYKRVVEIADNTTTTYEDGVADASLGATAPTDNGVPPNYSAIIYHQNRLFMIDPTSNFLYYTNLGEPYTVASTNFRQMADSAGDTLKGLGVYENGVVVFCQNSIWLVHMPDTDPANWVDIRLHSPYGSKSPFGQVLYDNKVLFPAMQNDKFVGFGAISGGTLDPQATLLTLAAAGSDLKSLNIEPDMFLIQESYVQNISGMVYKNKAYISVTYGTNQTRNNRIYVMDFSLADLKKQQRISWVPFTGLSAAQFTVYGGNLYYISSLADGFVYQMFNGSYDDDGSAIDSYIWTKEFAGNPEHTNYQKDFRFMNVLVELLGNYYMNVIYRTDSSTSVGTTQQIDLNPGGSVWGVMVWGTDVWGGGKAQEEVKVYLGELIGKRIQFKFSNQNTVNQGFKIHGFNFVYNVKGYR